MKKQYTVLAIIVALILGMGVSCAYHCWKNKVAVVDLSAVVAQSSIVRELKQEKITAEQEILQWLQESQKAVNDETDTEKQEALLKQYREEFAAKKEVIAQHYVQKLHEAESSINKIISDKAKQEGYSLVLAKGLTVYGGDDITKDIVEAVK